MHQKAHYLRQFRSSDAWLCSRLIYALLPCCVSWNKGTLTCIRPRPSGGGLHLLWKGKPMTLRRMSVVASVLSLGIGSFLATAAPASAETDHAGAQSVWITVTGDGSHASISNDDVHPGWLKLNIKDSTSPTIGAQVVVVQMRDGFSVNRLTADIGVQTNRSSTPAQSAASTRDINKIAIALGGGDTFVGTPFFRSDTIRLPGMGTYFVISSGAKNGPTVAGRLEARGSTVESGAPDHSGTISLGNGSADTITLSGHMPAKGTVKVRNNGDSVHLLQISKVADGVTDAQVQAEYDALMMNVFPTPGHDPAGLITPSVVNTGSDAVSPGHASLLSYNLPAGTYLLQCFVADDSTGIPHTFMGMHLIVHLS